MTYEEKILKYWEKNKIFEKSVNQRKKGKPFVFYEGPPYANGRPGIHHIEARAFKDIVLRYKALRGYFAPRRAGWDTHGLPTEMEVEKLLGIKSKKEIEEKIGVEKFVEEARKNVFLYKDDWEKITRRIAYWLDLKNAYVTMTNDYIENLWSIIKIIWEKGLFYEGHKILPWCSRCGTALSHHETAQGYKNTNDLSVIIKFQITNNKLQTNFKFQIPNEKTYILAWTTTLWTLPGNVALAVKRDIIYSFIKIKKTDENYILAKGRLSIIKEDYKILKEFKGKDLIGAEYRPLFDVVELKNEKSYKVCEADFVNTEDGTGVVHTAVMYGEDDYKLGKKIGLPLFHTVTEEGRFINSLKNGFAGLFVKSKETEKKLINYLRENGLLFSAEEYSHDYPFCWRCQTPLLYYARASWFFKITAVKRQMIKENGGINWFPPRLKKGRFGEWLSGARDWAVSRERYWGAPLPVWKCADCAYVQVVGSISELKKFSLGKKLPKNGKGELDLHKPYIDEIKLKCEKCGKEMARIPEVADVWFDSGAMPIASLKLKMKNEKLKIKEIIKNIPYPADYICEAIDQTRGWFYTLLAVSSLLGLKAPYKNVVSLGLVLDAKGQKMSKSRGNAIDPWDMINKYGADAVRWYFYTVNQPWDDKLFKEKDIQDAQRKFINIFWNSFVYLKTYSGKNLKAGSARVKNPKLAINQWLIINLNNLVREVSGLLDKYDIVSAARKIEDFVVEDVSHWYIRRVRDVLKNGNSVEAKETAAVFCAALKNLCVIAAPFTPFIAEEIYLGLRGGKKSVHLEDWPRDKRAQNKKEKSLLANMREARKIVSRVMEERAKAGIKVRQPVATLKLKIKNEKLKIKEEFLNLVKGEVNVKEIIFDKSIKGDIWLDTELTDELREEGLLRDTLRALQDLRKKTGLTPRDKPILYFDAKNYSEEFILKYKSYIAREVRFAKIEPKDLSLHKEKLSVAIKEGEIEIHFGIFK